MRRLVAMILTFTLCLQMTGQLTVTAAASSEEEARKEICKTNWIDDFGTDTIANYKVAGPDNGAWGNWQIVDGKLQVTGNPGANWWGTSLLLKDRIYDDFVMEFDADVSAGYGVILKAQDDATMQNSGLNKWHSGDAYVIMHWAPVESNASVQILDFDGTNGGRVLANAGSVGAMNSAHWKIMAVGDDIVITIADNNDMGNNITYTLNNSKYSSGMLGFYNLTHAGVTSLKVDNLSVTPMNSVLYKDDYSKNSMDDYFVAGPDNGAWGNWQIVDEKLQVTGNPGANWWGTSILTKKDYDNFVMEFDADVSAGYGVLLRAGDDAEVLGSGLNTWFGGDAYAIMHWAPVESSARVEIQNYNGSGNVIKNVGSIGAMTSAHWKIVADGNTIYIKITDNNNSKNTINYVLVEDTYLAGHIGFYNLTRDGVTSFKADNLIVKGFLKYTVEIPDITEPEAKISWTDDMSGDKGENYTAYGLWWNNAVSAITQADYTGVLGNEGGSTDGISYYYLDDYKFEDLVMEFDVVSTSAKAQYGVMLRAGNPGAGADQGDGYAVMYDGSWVFAGKLDGKFTQITATPTAYAYNPNDHGVTITHWKVVCVGDTIAVYFNHSDEPAIRVTDTAYKSGSIGFRTFAPANTANNVLIDNLSVKGTGTAPDDNKEPEKPEEITSIKEPEAKIAWTDDMNSNRGENYTAYGLWWNNTVSNMTNTAYTGVLGNEGGSGDGITYYYLKNYKFEDLVMEFDVVSTSAKAQYGVVLRAGNPGPGVDQADGYTVMYDGNWVFAGKLDGKFTQITSSPSVYAYNPQEHGITITHWKVVCVGDTIAVYFNHSNEPAIRVTDTTYKSGSVGFRAFTPAKSVKNVVIDNVSVKGNGTYTTSTANEAAGSSLAVASPKLDTYNFEWKDGFDKDTYTSYLAYGRWWNNVISENNGKDYHNILANEGGSVDGICYYYLRKYKWVDFTMDFDVSSVDSSAQYGVVLRAGTYSAGADDCDGYTVMYDGEWIFVGKLNGKFVQIKNTASAYAYNPKDNGITPKHWKITCIGNTIQVYLNGSDKPVITVYDSDFACGYVGFRTFAKKGQQTNVIFDNLHIKGSVLYEELTTMINSNRRKGKVSDYSALGESEKKTNKVIKNDTDVIVDNKDSNKEVSNNEASVSLNNFLIPGAIVLLFGVILIEVIIICRKRRSS